MHLSRGNGKVWLSNSAVQRSQRTLDSLLGPLAAARVRRRKERATVLLPRKQREYECTLHILSTTSFAKVK